jgi:hypothetical protein
MSDRLYVATRKGLFPIRKAGKDGGWTIQAPHFLGDPVTSVLPDARDGMLYAALNLGHFGVKLRRSANGGETWEEIAAPLYPPQPAHESGAPEDKTPWKLVQVWVVEPGGRDEPGTLWAGTIPGGLFRSTDRGTSWQLVESLWHRPERKEWFGGGYDYPGIHSVCVDPRDSRRVTVGISCGGAWQTADGGARRQPARPGPAPHRALRGAARHSLGPAPQRRVPLGRRGAELGACRQRQALRLRFCGRGPSARSRHRLVRAGGERRMPGAGGRQAGGGAHARWRPVF